MGAKFIWDTFNVDIVQAPLTQNPDQCSFTGIARQLEYQLRIEFAKAEPPYQLHPGPILNHKEWQRILNDKFPTRNKWRPWCLLKQLDKKSDGLGCPYMNGLSHWIKRRNCFHFGGDVDKVRKISEILYHNMPVSVTIDIYEGRYPHYAEYPYLKPNNNMLPKCTHLVVIVGLYTATENDQHGLKPGTYFLYQDSLRHYDSRDNGTRGLFSNCIGILDPELITLGYLGISKIPNFMLSVETANERKAYFDAKLQNKRKDIADLVEFRKTEQT